MLPVWWPRCYFLLSNVGEVTVFELAMVDYARFAVVKQVKHTHRFHIKTSDYFFTFKPNERA